MSLEIEVTRRMRSITSDWISSTVSVTGRRGETSASLLHTVWVNWRTGETSNVAPFV
jgi:hypothetical protein